ncbi:MAG TPA: VWA domain-containing protein [Ferruginibacter sp.]|nr:VWA domain-containing protein [Ferruginibacter sp.]
MLRFQHTSYLLFLAAIPLLVLLYYFVLRWKKKTIKKIGDERLVKELIKNYSPQRYAIKFVLILFAFVSGVFALANLRKPGGVEKVNRSGIDIMIALDVSKSMLADDVKPNRLERAKQSVTKLIDKLSNDRVGIVLFAGRAYLQMPLTSDHGAAKMYLSSANTDVVPTQGTVINDALKMCYASFNPKEKKYKAVVLISDGEDHDEGAIQTAGQMSENGIIINTVGIGSPQGATFMDELTNQPKKDNAGNIVISKLNEEELKKIAAEGKGAYQLFTNTDDLVSKLESQLENMDQRTITEDSQVNYMNYFPYFLAAALVLLLLEFFLSETKPLASRKVSVTRGNAGLTFLLIILCSLIPPGSFAQNEKALIKKGNEAYEKKEYENAAANYQKAIEKKPADPVAQYNLGNALYKNSKTDEAVSAYDKALSNPASAADKAKAFYNKGVVLQNGKKLPECIEAYKNALKLDPQDDDARQNLQKALQQLKQQEQKKDNKDNKEKKKPKEDQKKKEQEKQKPQEQNQPPKPQPSKLTKQDAEEKLKALLQQEKNLQDKLRRVNTGSVGKPEKDW